MAKSRSVPHWLRSLMVLPGALLPLLPSATCPACLAAYAGVLSALGLGFLFNAGVQLPLIFAFLVLAAASIAWSTRNHRRPGPLALTLLGSAAVITGRLLGHRRLHGGCSSPRSVLLESLAQEAPSGTARPAPTWAAAARHSQLQRVRKEKTYGNPSNPDR